MSDEQFNILLVEDSLSDVSEILALLNEAQRVRFDVERVDRLACGIDCLNCQKFDAVLLDLSLPDSQGLETFWEINKRAPGVAIVVFTGLEDEGLAMKAVQEGAQDYLVKGKVEADLLERSLRYAVGRKQAEEALVESTTRFRRLIHSNIVGIIVVDLKGTITEANDAFLDLLGYERESLPLAASQVNSGKWLEHDRQLIGQLLVNRSIPPWEKEFLCQDGHRVSVLIGVALLEQNSNECICFVLDITERKQAEEMLKAEDRLLKNLLDLHERERQLFAYEIHDGLLQYVVGAKLALETVCEKLSGQNGTHADGLSSASNLLEEAIGEGRRLIGELRPLIIDQKGILAAIVYLIREEKSQSGLEISFKQEVEFDRLPPLLEGTMFRIVQEAINNVKRHSKTTRAEIGLSQSAERLYLEIRDAGIGFDLEAVPENRFGLRGIRERARLFGGSATIESSPGEGTRILVELPVKIRPNQTN